jgi:hypothetical protein
MIPIALHHESEGEMFVELGITRQMLYRFAGLKRELRRDGQRLLDRRRAE